MQGRRRKREGREGKREEIASCMKGERREGEGGREDMTQGEKIINSPSHLNAPLSPVLNKVARET